MTTPDDTATVEYAVQRFGLHGEWDVVYGPTRSLPHAVTERRRWLDLIAEDDRLKMRVVQRTVPAWTEVDS